MLASFWIKLDLELFVLEELILRWNVNEHIGILLYEVILSYIYHQIIWTSILYIYFYYYYYFIFACMTVRRRGRTKESIHVYRNLIISQHFTNSAVYFCLTTFFIGNWRGKKQQNFCILSTRALVSLPLYHSSVPLFSPGKKNVKSKFNISFWDFSVSYSLRREWRNSFCYQFSSHLHLYQPPFLGDVIV